MLACTAQQFKHTPEKNIYIFEKITISKNLCAWWKFEIIHLPVDRRKFTALQAINNSSSNIHTTWKGKDKKSIRISTVQISPNDNCNSYDTQSIYWKGAQNVHFLLIHLLPNKQLFFSKTNSIQKVFFKMEKQNKYKEKETKQTHPHDIS